MTRTSSTQDGSPIPSPVATPEPVDPGAPAVAAAPIAARPVGQIGRRRRRWLRRSAIGCAVLVLIVLAGTVTARTGRMAGTAGDTVLPSQATRVPEALIDRPAAEQRSPESVAVPTPRGAGAAGTNAVPAEVGAAVAAQKAEGGADATVPGAPVTVVGPPLVRTATLDLSVRSEVDAVVAQLRSLATGAGGYVGSQDSSSVGRADYSTLTLRVPADKLDDVIARASALGKVRSAKVESSDVGTVSVDLDARIAATKAQVEQLQAIAVQAKTVGEVLSVRSQLAPVQTELEQLNAQRRSLADRVALASLTVSVARNGATPAPVPSGWWAEVMSSAVARLQAIAAVLILGTVTLAPFALLGMVGWLVVRSVRRRRFAVATSAEPSAPNSAPAADAA